MRHTLTFFFGLAIALHAGCGDDDAADAARDASADSNTDSGASDAADVGSDAADVGSDAADVGSDVTDADATDATDAGSVGGDKLVAFITVENETLRGASGAHQVHVVGPSGDYSYVWGNEDYVYTGNTIDMDTSDDAELIVVGGGQGNINNKVLVFDYAGRKQWETDSNGNSQGTRFYQGNGDPLIAVGFHDDRADRSPTDTRGEDVLGFYARDLEGELLDWQPEFGDGGGTAPFRGGGLNVWHLFADEVNDRLFIQGEFQLVRTSAGVRVDVPVSRLAVYEQNADGSFPEEPARVPRFGASWFETSSATKHVGNPWTMAQTRTHYYVGGHSFDRVEDLSGRVHNVESLVRINVSDYDLDTSWLPSFGPAYNAATTTATNCVVVRELATHGDEILVGGRFNAFQGSPRENLAAFDAESGAITDRFADVTVNRGEVYSIAIDGHLAYLGGTFRSITDRAGTHARNRVACIDLRTNTVTPWDPNSSSRVNRVRVIPAP